MTRRAGVLLLAALALRAGLAVLTETHPLFPPYYYQDAKDFHESALRVNAELASGKRLSRLTPGKELYTRWTAFLYRRFGPKPLVSKFVNAALGAGGAGLWGLAAACAAGPEAATVVVALVGFWPSHAYYTSQAMKDSATLFALASTILLFCLASREGDSRRRGFFGAGGAAAGLLLGLLRPYLLPPLAIAVGVGALAALKPGRGSGRAAAAALLLWGLAPLAAYRPVKGLLLNTLAAKARHEDTDILPRNTGASPSGPLATAPLWTPRGLSQYRASLLGITRDWSVYNTGRPIETLLFPEARFESWSQVALFAPKAAFYALFMPLPGLYPMEGKIGRMLSAAEGLLLLALAALAVIGLKGRALTPAASLLLAFFVVSVPAASFVEFDLGSASRHRLQYLPFLFPFAAAELARRASRRAPR